MSMETAAHSVRQMRMVSADDIKQPHYPVRDRFRLSVEQDETGHGALPLVEGAAAAIRKSLTIEQSLAQEWRKVLTSSVLGAVYAVPEGVQEQDAAGTRIDGEELVQLCSVETQ